MVLFAKRLFYSVQTISPSMYEGRIFIIKYLVVGEIALGEVSFSYNIILFSGHCVAVPRKLHPDGWKYVVGMSSPAFPVVPLPLPHDDRECRRLPGADFMKLHNGPMVFGQMY
jgi:hypothetical protein